MRLTSSIAAPQPVAAGGEMAAGVASAVAIPKREVGWAAGASAGAGHPEVAGVLDVVDGAS